MMDHCADITASPVFNVLVCVKPRALKSWYIQPGLAAVSGCSMRGSLISRILGGARGGPYTLQWPCSLAINCTHRGITPIPPQNRLFRTRLYPQAVRGDRDARRLNPMEALLCGLGSTHHLRICCRGGSVGIDQFH